MLLLNRFSLWAAAGVGALTADVLTKAAHHTTVVNNYAHAHPAILAAIGLFLAVLGLQHSRWLAIGAGLMFGGLCGNGGQLLLQGYATDWIPLAGWLTNVADLAGAAGLICCLTGYAVIWAQRADTLGRHTSPVE